MKSELIKSIFLDELDRNKRLIVRYEKEILELPKGSVFRRTIGRQEYLYLNYRDGKKVISKFLGKPGTVDISELEKKLLHRKELLALVKKLKSEQKELKKELK